MARPRKFRNSRVRPSAECIRELECPAKMSGEHVRRQFPCSAGLSVTVVFPLFYVGPSGVGKHKGNSDNAGTAARATPPFFNADKKGGRTGGCLKASHKLIRTTAHKAGRRELRRCICYAHTVPKAHSRWAPQCKLAQFPLLLLSPQDCSVCEANNTAGGEVFPMSPSLSEFPPIVQLSLHLHHLEACAESPAPLWFNLLLVTS